MLTIDEINFLIKTVHTPHTPDDEELAKPYYSLEKILH